MNKVSILIPVYNSEKTIVELCTELMQVLADIPNFEILLVNDGSTDNSYQLCERLCEEHPGTVVYLELSRNFGEHNAVMAGLLHVTGNYCIIMDDDFQNPPQETLKLIKEIRKGYDVVYARYQEQKQSFLRKLGSHFNDMVAGFVINKPPRLYLSSFKIINRFLINEIIKFDGHDPYIDGIILRSTNRIASIQLAHMPRRYGQSGYTFRKLLSLWASMTMNFSIMPLRVIGVMGFVLTISSFIFAIHRRFFDPPFDPLTDAEIIMAALMLLLGLLFLCIAMLAEYIGRIYLLLHKEPQYIIRKNLSNKHRK